MPLVLLRPHVLGCKNRLLQPDRPGALLPNVMIFLLALAMAVIIYFGTRGFFVAIMQHPQYDPLLPHRLLGICLMAFFFLLLFSSAIAALGYLYSALDLQLLLTMPVSHFRFYCTRMIEITVSSSWMFVLFAVPSLLGFYTSFELPATFLPLAAAVLFALMLIPAAIGSIFITLFVNLVPPYRMKDLLVGVALLLIGLVLHFSHQSHGALSTSDERFNELVKFLYTNDDPQPYWLPSAWAAELLSSYIGPSENSPLLLGALLFGSTIGLCALSYLLYDLLFMRGWSMAMSGDKRFSRYGSTFGENFGRAILPFAPQFRAVCYKEARMFIRDTQQSLQLLLLLMLTFIYLYNFRALRLAPEFDNESAAWWQAILSTANISFGAFVISAIATRFVFPTISLEGRAYAQLRVTPLSVDRLLFYKFVTWSIPISCVSTVLLVSGTLAIQAPWEAIFATAFCAVALTIGIVGLGVGFGALYAKFDWDSPAQVSASLGSLIYMLVSFAMVLVSILPAFFLFIITCVPNFSLQMEALDRLMLIGCSCFLILVINGAAARHALLAGANRLKELEN